MHYSFFIGIDVSKEHLDLALLVAGQMSIRMKIKNEPKAIRAALQKLTTSQGGYWLSVPYPSGHQPVPEPGLASSPIILRSPFFIRFSANAPGWSAPP